MRNANNQVKYKYLRYPLDNEDKSLCILLCKNVYTFGIYALSPLCIQLGGGCTEQTDGSCSSSYDENTIEGVWVAGR